MPVLDRPVNIEFGNHRPTGPGAGNKAITYVHVPAAYTHAEGFSGAELAQIERVSVGQPTHMPDHEALVAVTHPHAGIWNAHSRRDPAFVWSDHDDIARVLSEYYQCPVGRPGDYEDYWRRVGAKDVAPGVPQGAIGPDALLTNTGRALWGNALGGGSTGTTGTSSSATGTTLQGTVSVGLSANQFADYRIYASLASGGMVFGNIISHTSGTSPTFTVDQWYMMPETGAAGTTPNASGFFGVPSGGSVAAWYMGITTTNITPSPSDVSLSGESSISGMGRKICTYALTSSVSPASYTITAVYTLGTAQGSPLSFYAMGAFAGVVLGSGITMFLETSFSAPFSVQHVSDQATVTDTVSGS
jgi:hypothetical protein